MNQHEKIRAFAALLKKTERITVLTGAGISTESGIPDFRSSDGIYQTMTSEEIFDIGFFQSYPDRFYAAIAPVYRKILEAKPSIGHTSLVRLEKFFHKKVTVVTQNIDSLHLKAGSADVAEIHGTFRSLTCLQCEKQSDSSIFQKELEQGTLLRCPFCKGILKPDITFYGEELPPAPLAAAQRAMWEARLLLVLGTSLAVYPAAALPRECDSGIPYVIVNKTPTWLDGQSDLVFHESIGKVMGAVLDVMTSSTENV